MGNRHALQRLTWHTVLAVNVLSTGLLLGLLQWGVFFLLQSYLASTAVVYLLGTSCWLLGSLLGLTVTGERGEICWAAGMLLAYYLFRYIAITFPYNLTYLPVLLGLIMAMGGYAGRFFRYRAHFYRAPKWLFFLENCGFVSGMAFTIVALFYFDATVLVSAPLVVAACMLASLLSLRWCPAPHPTSVAGKSLESASQGESAPGTVTGVPRTAPGQP